MTELTFYDAAYPPANPPATDGVAFYIGGDAAHVWSLAEIEAAGRRYRLPIFVRSNPRLALAQSDVNVALDVLHSIGAPKGTLIAWDTETAASPSYMAVVWQLLTTAGYFLLDYGSQSDLFGNDLPRGGYYWGAEWTGRTHIAQGDAGTQYAEDGTFDLDIFKPGLPFWDTHTADPKPVNWMEHIMQNLPTVKPGDKGAAVRKVQGLCTAYGHAAAVDGEYGPLTTIAVRNVQTDAKIAVDGVVGPDTWTALLT